MCGASGLGALPVARLCAELSLSFHDLRVLKAAFTHSSYKNEHRARALEDNERLEFLGDAVLELCVSQYLFRQFPDCPEGELTRMRAGIVCEASLVSFARQLHFPAYLRLGRGEELSGGRERASLLADAFEAFIGALYIDSGIAAVEVFLQKYFYPGLEDLENFVQKDYKTLLQERVQSLNVGEVLYQTVDEHGPAHDRRFSVRVTVGGETRGAGLGRSKKEAEQRAAAEALSWLASLPASEGGYPCS